jgi:hypothetical protein
VRGSPGSLDPRVLQFKPGTLIDDLLMDELLEVMAQAIGRSALEVRGREVSIGTA